MYGGGGLNVVSLGKRVHFTTELENMQYMER